MMMIFVISQKQSLVAEIYKINNNLNPPVMDILFERGNIRYNFRNFQEFVEKRKRTVKVGFKSLNYRSSQLWSILPENVRPFNSLVQLRKSQ